MTRIWNVTNKPGLTFAPQNLLVLGKLLAPGQSLQVDEESLKTARKIQQDVKVGRLAIGKGTPEYLQKAPRVVLPDSMARSHGAAPVDAIAAVAPEVVEAKLSESSGESKKPKRRKW